MCDYSEYDELLSRYFDGDATADDVTRLEAALARDERLAEYVSQWCLMHRQVVELLREDALHHLMDQFATGAPSLPKKIFSPLAADDSGRPSSAAFAEPHMPAGSTHR